MKLGLAHAAMIVYGEARRIAEKFKPYNSPHEFYGVFAEEAHELMLALHANDRKQMILEAKQCAAVCMRFISEQEADDAQ